MTFIREYFGVVLTYLMFAGFIMVVLFLGWPWIIAWALVWWLGIELLRGEQ